MGRGGTKHRDSRRTRRVERPLSWASVFRVVAFALVDRLIIPGSWVRYPPAPHTFCWGRTLSRGHRASAAFPHPGPPSACAAAPCRPRRGRRPRRHRPTVRARPPCSIGPVLSCGPKAVVERRDRLDGGCLGESADGHGETIEESDVAADAGIERPPAVGESDIEIPCDGLDVGARRGMQVSRDGMNRASTIPPPRPISSVSNGSVRSIPAANARAESARTCSLPESTSASNVMFGSPIEMSATGR